MLRICAPWSIAAPPSTPAAAAAASIPVAVIVAIATPGPQAPVEAVRGDACTHASKAAEGRGTLHSSLQHSKGRTLGRAHHAADFAATTAQFAASMQAALRTVVCCVAHPACSPVVVVRVAAAGTNGQQLGACRGSNSSRSSSSSTYSHDGYDKVQQQQGNASLLCCLLERGRETLRLRITAVVACVDSKLLAPVICGNMLCAHDAQLLLSMMLVV
jgi:hypothetical protein